MTENFWPHALVVAYACHPDRGSEPGAGWEWLRAAAKRHHVTVVTGHVDDQRLEEEIARRGLPVEVVRVKTLLDAIGRDSRFRYLRYGLWLAMAAHEIRRLERVRDFAVGHHVTYACDWLPSPLAALQETPFIWGPVGGSTYPVHGLAKLLPLRSRVFEGVRHVIGRLSRRTLAASTVRRAALIVALNEDSASMFSDTRVIVEQNAAFDYGGFPNPVEPTAPSAGPPTAIYAGRLLAWKGVDLAILAMAEADAADWTFDIFGDGPDRERLLTLTREHGLEKRIVFRGHAPRDILLGHVARADAFVFPSLHDSAPWAVAEASALGVPVLCFRCGAAPMLAGPNGRLLDPTVPQESIAARLREIQVEQPRRTPHRAFSIDRLPQVVDEWYRAVSNDRPNT